MSLLCFGKLSAVLFAVVLVYSSKGGFSMRFRIQGSATTQKGRTPRMSQAEMVAKVNKVLLRPRHGGKVRARRIARMLGLLPHVQRRIGIR